MTDLFKEMSIIEWIILVFALISFIINFVSLITKKTNILDSIKESLMEWLPIAINLAEVNGTSGDNKRSEVIRNALKYVGSKLGRQLTEDESVYFTSLVGKQLEMILSTPQKKENEK